MIDKLPYPFLHIVMSYLIDKSKCIKYYDPQNYTLVSRAWAFEVLCNCSCKPSKTVPSLCLCHDMNVICCWKTINTLINMGQTTFFLHQHEDLSYDDIKTTLSWFNDTHKHIQLRIVFECCSNTGVCVILDSIK
jgi:hypothetical protein